MASRGAEKWRAVPKTMIAAALLALVVVAGNNGRAGADDATQTTTEAVGARGADDPDRQAR